MHSPSFNLEHDADYVMGIAFNHDGSRMICAAGDHKVYVWDVDEQRVLRTLPGGMSSDHVAVANDVVVVFGRDYRLYDINSGTNTQRLTGDANRLVVWGDFTTSGDHLVVQILDERIRSFHVNSGGRWLAEQSMGGICGCALAPDGRSLAVLLPDHLKVLSVPDLELEWSRDVPDGFLGVTWTPAGIFVSTSSNLVHVDRRGAPQPVADLAGSLLGRPTAERIVVYNPQSASTFDEPPRELFAEVEQPTYFAEARGALSGDGRRYAYAWDGEACASGRATVKVWELG